MPSDVTAPGPRQPAKRVLMVIESLARGGAERQMLALTRGLLAQGYQVQILELIGVVAGQADFREEMASLGVRMRRASTSRSRYLGRLGAKIWRACALPFGFFGVDWLRFCGLQKFSSILAVDASLHCRGLARMIGEFDPDVVNCWSDHANLIGGFVAAHLNVSRIVLGLRLTPPFWLGQSQSADYRSAYLTLLATPNVRMVNNSHVSKDEYDRWLGLSGGTIAVVHNGLLPSLVRPNSCDEITAHRARLGLPAGAAVVGAVMRFAAQKDPALWLETAAVIHHARPDVYFLLAGYGHGTIAGHLRKLGAALGLADRLIMPGAVTDTAPIYAAMDVFLLTSSFENTPNALIEAQGAGVAVVAPDVGGVRETMRDRETGLLVAERAASNLAAAVLRILHEPDGCLTKMRRAGRMSHEDAQSRTCLCGGTVRLRENDPRNNCDL